MSGPTLLIVDQRHNIISCAVHEYALLPSQVLSHLNKHHTQDTTPEERKELLEEVERCRSKMSLKEQYEDFTISDSPIPAVQGLRALVVPSVLYMRPHTPETTLDTTCLLIYVKSIQCTPLSLVIRTSDKP
ncbi:hypothetical protein P3342_000001, partial [Pyrenophora teres f. teres]